MTRLETYRDWRKYLVFQSMQYRRGMGPANQHFFVDAMVSLRALYYGGAA